jgi:hypothetical protein
VVDVGGGFSLASPADQPLALDACRSTFGLFPETLGFVG